MQWFRKPGRRPSPDPGGRGLHQAGQGTLQGRVSTRNSEHQSVAGVGVGWVCAFSERWGRAAKTVSRIAAWGPQGCGEQAGLPACAWVLLPPDRQRGWKAGLGWTGSPHLDTYHGGLALSGVRCGWVHTLQGWGKDLAQF